MVGQIIKPSYYRPPPAPAPAASVPDHHADADADTDNDGTTAPKPLAGSSHREEWLLVDSTPASCVQIGLYHAFKSRGPIELVVSGPNYGRNTTAVFALSSGTLGAALEAAVCGVRAVALSYAFFAPGHDDAVIAACGRAAVRVVEGLVGNWDGDVGLYSVNVPVVADVERAKVLWTRVLQNRWTGGSCFKEIEVPEEEDRGPEEEEARIREEEGEGERQSSLTRRKATGTVGEDDVEDSGKQTLNGHVRYTHKHFKWAPRFKDVYESVEQAAPGNDGWAIKEGHIRSVLRTDDISS
jgi:5'/3'-nucleotidase SurE